MAREGERAAEPGEVHAKEGEDAAGFGEEAERVGEPEVDPDEREVGGKERQESSGKSSRREGRQRSRETTPDEQPIYDIYHEDIDQIVRYERGRVQAAEPTALQSWMQRKQPERGALENSETAQIVGVHVRQLGASASAGGRTPSIPFQVTIDYTVTVQGGPEERESRSYGLVYIAPGKHRRLEKLDIDLQKRLRVAIESGRMVVKTPGFELEVESHDSKEGWARVKVTRVDGAYRLTDRHGDLVPLTKELALVVPYSGEQ